MDAGVCRMVVVLIYGDVDFFYIIILFRKSFGALFPFQRGRWKSLSMVSDADRFNMGAGSADVANAGSNHYHVPLHISN